MNKTPAILLSPLRLLPDEVHSFLAAATCNHLLRGQTLTERFLEIEGKTVALRVQDVPCTVQFRFRGGRLRPAPNVAPDAVISGDVLAFMELLRGTQDPDTLFFRRKLCMEGDTETGVHIKNILAALEYDWDGHIDAVLPQPLRAPAKRTVDRVARLYRWLRRARDERLAPRTDD